MLILSRKTGQQIQVGEMIEVTVLEIRGGRVRLGFSAPPEVGIRRQELHPRSVTLEHEVTVGNSAPLRACS